MRADRHLVVALVFALVLMACGSEDSSDPTGTAPATTAAPATTVAGVPGWAVARTSEQVCALVDVAAAEAILGVTISQPLTAHPAKPQCTLDFGAGAVAVAFLSPDGFTGLTASEAFAARVAADSQQGWDGIGESDLGDDSVYVQRDTTGDVSHGKVLVLVGEELVEVLSPLGPFDGEALVAFAGLMIEAMAQAG